MKPCTSELEGITVLDWTLPREHEVADLPRLKAAAQPDAVCRMADADMFYVRGEDVVRDLTIYVDDPITHEETTYDEEGRPVFVTIVRRLWTIGEAQEELKATRESAAEYPDHALYSLAALALLDWRFPDKQPRNIWAEPYLPGHGHGVVDFVQEHASEQDAWEDLEKFIGTRMHEKYSQYVQLYHNTLETRDNVAPHLAGVEFVESMALRGLNLWQEQRQRMTVGSHTM